MTILASYSDQGSRLAVWPVVEELRKRGKEVALVLGGIAAKTVTEEEKRLRIFTSVEQVVSACPKPEALITGVCGSKDRGFGQAVVSTYRDRRSTIAITDDWGNQLLPDWTKLEHMPDHICVNDRIDAEITTLAWPGFLSGNIHTTGWPGLDGCAGIDVVRAERQVRRRLNIPAGLPIVLLAGQVGFAGIVCQAVAAALNKIGREVCFIAREHSRLRGHHGTAQKVQAWDRGVKKFFNGIVRDSSGFDDIMPLVASSTVVVSAFSTVLIKAAALRKPNISILYPRIMRWYIGMSEGRLKEYPLVELGCSRKVENRWELREALEQSLSGAPNPLGLLTNQEKHFSLDGKNAERAAGAVMSLI